MQCPKCGSGVSAERSECPICFAKLAPDERLAGPSIMQAPKVSAYVDQDDPVVGIPGIDNHPKEEATGVPNYLSGNVGIGGAQAASSGEVRVSLTGEVIEVAQPSRPSAASPGM